MALDQSIIYATYEDDGLNAPGGQSMSNTQPRKSLLIFNNMPLAREYEVTLQKFSNGRKNPRITGFYSMDADEQLVSCWPARIIEPVIYPKNRGAE